MSLNPNYTLFSSLKNVKKLMVLSSNQGYSNSPKKFKEINNVNSKYNNIKAIRQNGQIQIYQSAHRGSFSNIIRDSLRNAALGRKVLLAQIMKGGVKQGINNPINLCGNLLWVRPSNSYDLFRKHEIENNEIISHSIKESIIELWEFCKKQLLSGEQDQIILDEIFMAVKLGIIKENDLISTLENRFISGDVILTGTTIPKELLLMADQVTELRS